MPIPNRAASRSSSNSERKSRSSVGYQHVRGLHLMLSVNQNVPSCVASGSNNGCRPNSDYGNNSQYSSLADSHYDGLHVSFVQRPARWGNYRVSYTFSKALDNVGEFFFSSPIDNFNIWQDYGRSDDDQRHRLVFDGTIHSSTGHAQHCLAAHQPWLSIERPCCSTTPRCRSTSLPGRPPFRAQPRVRLSMGFTSTATPATASIS